MTGKRYWYLALVASVALIAGTLTGCKGSKVEEEATPTPIPTPVVPSKPTYKVQLGPIAEQVKFTGRIAPVEEEQLYFRTDGRVAKVNVEQGDKVSQGDILAELEIGDLLNQLAQAKLNLEQVELQYKNAESTLSEQRMRTEIDLAVAKLRLEQAKVNDPAPSVKIAEVNRQRAGITLRQYGYDFDSVKNIPGVGAMPQSAALEQATMDFQIADAQYQQALQGQKSWEYDIKILEQGVRLAQLNLDRVGAEADPIQAQEVAKAKLVVERLEAQATDARLVAPFDGEVTMVGAYAGRNVTAYRPAINVAAPGALEISAELTSETMAKLSIGQACTIVIVNYPSEEFHGSIRRLPYPYGTGGSSTAGTAEEDRSTRASIDDASDVELEKGSLVRVTVTLQQKDSVLWLPPEAIRTFQGKDFVLVLAGEGQQRVPVKLGIKAEDRVEILSGVEEGQVVVGP